MNYQSRRTLNMLKALQALFYALFVFLWFKDNFLPLRKIHVSSAVPLAGLILITACRAFVKFKSSPPKFRIKFNKDLRVLALILLLATAVHIPYLIHSYGLMDSDEAIPTLQGKHIAEGMRPALFYYGALFQGSLPQHGYALFFKVFGYSVFLVKLAAYLAFAAFLCLQYFLLKNIFSREFAIAVGLFYCLPFSHLIISSFDVGSGFPVIFFLGALIFTLTYKIYDRGKDRLLGTLGFVMGMAFWTHQISVVFILTSGFFLVLRYKFRVQKYLSLALFFLLGILPVLMSEIYSKFALVRWLSGGESAGFLSWTKIDRGKRLVLSLISSGPSVANVIYLVLLFLGLAVLAAPSLKKKKLQFTSLFAVYFLAFAAVYLLSSFSAAEVSRYLYILYLAIPVLFASTFFWVKPKALRSVSPVLFFIFVFFVSGAKTSLIHYRDVKDMHQSLVDVTTAMAGTGEKYWKGNYWVSYLINAVSKERLIVASTTVERYPYYRLVLDSETSHMNYVFARDVVQASSHENKRMVELTALLSRLHKSYQTIAVDQWHLVYSIKGYIYPKNLFFPPENVPEVILDGIEATKADLAFRFTAKEPLPTNGFRLNVEIPGYCARFMPIGPGKKFEIRIPYPPEPRVRLKTYLDYRGLFLDPTLKETDCLLPSAPSTLEKYPLEYLSGFGPRESLTGKKWQALEKEARFQVNQPLGPASKIVMTIFSPFNFNDLWWHDEFSQDVEIFINDQFIKKTILADGHNTLTIECPPALMKSGANIVTLRFKYALVLSISDHWKTAAYLETLKID